MALIFMNKNTWATTIRNTVTGKHGKGTKKRKSGINMKRLLSKFLLLAIFLPGVAFADQLPNVTYNYSSGQTTVTGTAIDPDHGNTVRIGAWIDGQSVTTIYASGGWFTFNIPGQYHDGLTHNLTLNAVNIEPDGTAPGSPYTTVNLSILVHPKPQASIAWSPSQVNYGQSSTLIWSSQYATDCVFNGASRGSSGSWVGTNRTANQTVSMNCTGPGGTSSTVSAYLTVNPPPNQAPTVSASGNLIYSTSDNVAISATASDPDGSVMSVSFKLYNANSSVLISQGTDTSSPYEHNFGLLNAGNYQVVVTAQDNDGQTGSGDSINFAVNAPAPVPSLTNVQYTPNPAYVGDQQGFSFNYSNVLTCWMDPNKNPRWATPVVYVADTGVLKSGTFSTAGTIRTVEDRWTQTVSCTGEDGTVVDLGVDNVINPTINLAPTVSASVNAAFENSENVIVTVEASDTDGGISLVRVHRYNADTNAPLGYLDLQAPNFGQSYQFDFGLLSAGNYRFVARAYDDKNLIDSQGGSTVTTSVNPLLIPRIQELTYFPNPVIIGNSQTFTLKYENVYACWMDPLLNPKWTSRVDYVVDDGILQTGTFTVQTSVRDSADNWVQTIQCRGENNVNVTASVQNNIIEDTGTLETVSISELKYEPSIVGLNQTQEFSFVYENARKCWMDANKNPRWNTDVIYIADDGRIKSGTFQVKTSERTQIDQWTQTVSCMGADGTVVDTSFAIEVTDLIAIYNLQYLSNNPAKVGEEQYLTFDYVNASHCEMDHNKNPRWDTSVTYIDTPGEDLSGTYTSTPVTRDAIDQWTQTVTCTNSAGASVDASVVNTVEEGVIKFINLSWDAIDGAEFYRMQLSDDEGVSWETVASTVQLTHKISLIPGAYVLKLSGCITHPETGADLCDSVAETITLGFTIGESSDSTITEQLILEILSANFSKSITSKNKFIANFAVDLALANNISQVEFSRADGKWVVATYENGAFVYDFGILPPGDYILAIRITDVNGNTYETSQSFSVVRQEELTITDATYDVYEAADGTLFLVSASTNDVYKVVYDWDLIDQNGQYFVFLSSMEELNNANAILLSGYQTSIVDMDGDGDRDLLLIPSENSGYDHILISSIDALYHTVTKENAKRNIGDLSMLASEVIDATRDAIDRSATTDIVGTIPSTAKISSGTVTYNIPVKIAPGRRGMQPEVALSYNSGGGGGLAGIGWQLSATSAVSRCGASWIEDGETGRANLSDSDRLCLDGEKLILIDGEYGSINSEYRTREDSFRKVELLGGDYDTANSYFKVIDKSGKNTYYGESANSTQLPSGSTVPYKWVIERVIDNSVTQNNIIYEYTNSAGEFYLTDIFYTGINTSKGNRKVHFEYETRDDKSFRHISGGTINNSNRLKEVVSSVDSLNVAKYKLIYESTLSGITNLSRLESITQCGYVNNSNSTQTEQCLPKRKFSYSGDSLSFNQVESTNTLFNADMPWSIARQKLADFNNDGVLDVVRNRLLHLMSLDSNNQMVFDKVIELPFVGSEDADPGERFHLGTLDFDRDGQLDILGLTNNGLAVASLNDLQNGFDVNYLNIPMACHVDRLYLTTGFGPEAVGYNYEPEGGCRANAVPDNTGGYYLFHRVSNLFEVPGESTNELKVSRINQSCTNNLCSTQTIAGIYDHDESYHPSDPEPVDFQILDFDGDGDPDLYRLLKNGDEVEIVIVINNQSGAGATATSSFEKSEIALPIDYKWAAGAGHHWMDANGDSLKDLFIFDGTTWSLYLNKGGTLANPINTGIGPLKNLNGSKPPMWTAHTLHNSIKIVDYNGDGLEDVMFLDRQINPRNCLEDRTLSMCDDIVALHDLNVSPLAYGKYSVLLTSVIGQDSVDFILLETDLIGSASYFYPTDINSDGVLDFVGARGLNDHTTRGTYEPLVFLQFGKVDNQSINPDLLLIAEDDTSVENFGIKDEFMYQSITQHRIEKLGTSLVDNSDLAGGDYFRIPSSMMVAVEHRVNNVLSGKNTVQYEYSNPIFHQSGLGFLGFETIKSIDLAKGVTNEAWYRMDYPLNGRMTNSELSETSDGSTLKLETLTWCDSLTNGCNSNHPGVFFTHPKAKSTSYYDVDGNVLKEESRTFINYDAYGNLTDHSTILSDSTTTHTTTVSNKYVAADENTWWVNKLDETTTTKSVNYTDERGLRVVANGAKTITRDVTWKPGYARQLSSETISANDTELTKTISYHSYDIYGNLTNIESSGTAIEGTNYTDVQNSLILEFDYSDYAGYFIGSEKNGLWATDAVTRTWDIYHGQVLTERLANGVRSTNAYDAFGRISSSGTNTVPTQNVAYEWCDINCETNSVYKKSSISDGAPPIIEEFNRQNQLTKRLTNSLEASQQQIEESIVYDALGRVTTQYLPAFVGAISESSIRFLDYDVLGRPASKVTSNAPQRYTASYVYSGVTTLITVDGADDGSLSMARRYNLLDQLMSSTDAYNLKTHMRYDANGSVILVEDAEGNEIHASYDSFGNKLGFDDPNNGIWSFRYNALGQLRWQQDAKNVEVRFDYDGLGRNTHRYVDNQLDASWIYDTRTNGLLSSESRNNLNKDYYYDFKGRVTTESSVITHAGVSKQFDFNYAYDSYYGRVKALQYPTGEIEAYQYDQYGYLIENVDPNGTNNLVSADEVLRQIDSMSALGKVTSQKYLNGLYEIQSYFESGETERVCVHEISSCIGSEGLAKIHYYGFNNFGNLTDKQEVVKQVAEHYAYDDLHRVTRATRSYTGYEVPAFLPSESIDYDYDSLGNLTFKTDYALSYVYSGGETGGPNAVKSITKLDDSVVNFSYDSNGNLTSGDDLSVVYDAFNKPTSIVRNQVTSSFEYGADDQRYLQTVTTENKITTTFYVDKRFEEIEVRIGSQVSSEKRHYFGDYAVLTHKGNKKSLKFLHNDRLSSTFLVTEGFRTTQTISDIAELEIERRSFDIFGKPRDDLWGDSTDGKLLSDVSTRGFTDHEHLDDVELIHMNGRAYDYNLGRFLSVDPFIQMPQSSQSINAYSYLMNNPLSGTDPTGYMGEGSMLSIFNENGFEEDTPEDKDPRKQREKKKKKQQVGDEKTTEEPLDNGTVDAPTNSDIDVLKNSANSLVNLEGASFSDGGAPIVNGRRVINDPGFGDFFLHEGLDIALRSGQAVGGFGQALAGGAICVGSGTLACAGGAVLIAKGADNLVSGISGEQSVSEQVLVEATGSETTGVLINAGLDLGTSMFGLIKAVPRVHELGNKTYPLFSHIKDPILNETAIKQATKFTLTVEGFTAGTTVVDTAKKVNE